MNYFDAAYDHTRAKMLREIAAGWEAPVPVGMIPALGAGGSTVIRDAGAGRVTIASESNPPQYAPLSENTWSSPLESPLSTFSIDVDTASWTNIRAMIERGVTADQIPDDAIRIEEMINYFDWDYPQPDGEHPFATAIETASQPLES